MKINNIHKLIIFSVLGLIFVYIMLNWAMSSVVHGKKEVMIPDVKGKSIADAVNLLSPLNLGLKKDGEENDERLPVGTIIRQSPLSGMTVREGKIIRVIVSQGGKVLYVPSVLGQMARSAEIMLRSAGLTIGEESTKYSLVSKKDEVISQDPAAGQSVERDAMVNMVISLGAPPQDIKLMPDWNGKKLDETVKWAAASGIALEVRREKNPAVPTDTVFKQEPALDTDITESKQAVVYVSDAGGDSSAVFSKMFRYDIPQGAGDKQIRLTMQDDNGEMELFRGSRAPGSKLELPINPKGNARIRIFINNILVEEREAK
jgi:eukaryotic-like serine/threonine-protein kinase